MQIEKLEIPDVVLIKPMRFKDQRGWFQENWKKSAWDQQFDGINFHQENTSMSLSAGTLRGLHLQTPPAAQAKLLEVLSGEIFDVAIDLRTDSETYGKWVGQILSEENGYSMFIPVGFAHGFLTLQDKTRVRYKCSAEYMPEAEVGLRFDDPEIAIEWPKSAGDFILSEKDLAGKTLADFTSPFRCDNT
ncbi:MAG: dTDP-4-dehydrorhamnose 3,5-epimerase [Pseudomonadota bacterium]